MRLTPAMADADLNARWGRFGPIGFHSNRTGGELARLFRGLADLEETLHKS